MTIQFITDVLGAIFICCHEEGVYPSHMENPCPESILLYGPLLTRRLLPGITWLIEERWTMIHVYFVVKMSPLLTCFFFVAVWPNNSGVLSLKLLVFQ
jgi:hypothetical protein